MLDLFPVRPGRPISAARLAITSLITLTKKHPHKTSTLQKHSMNPVKTNHFDKKLSSAPHCLQTVTCSSSSSSSAGPSCLPASVRIRYSSPDSKLCLMTCPHSEQTKSGSRHLRRTDGYNLSYLRMKSATEIARRLSNISDNFRPVTTPSFFSTSCIPN